MTKSGISGVAGDTAMRTGDKATGIAKIFDRQRVQKEVAAQTQITQTFSVLAPKQVATYAGEQIKEIDQRLSSEADPQRRATLLAERGRWEEGGTYRVLMHTAIGGLAGDVAGAAGAGAGALAAPALNDLQSQLEGSLVKAGMNAALAKGVAANVSGLAAAGMGGAVGGAAGAGAGLSVDANNRQLHFDEKQKIAAKANGDKTAEERLTKAACYEVRCWAQFPEGSMLYRQSYVSQSEAAGLKQEIAWVNQQKINGDFLYSRFQKFSDGIAEGTGISSINGRGTFNGQFISNLNQSFRRNDCVTAECAAGMAPFRGNNPPDYLAAQINFYAFSAGGAINLHNGEIFGQWGLGRQYPAYTAQPGVSLTAGKIDGGSNGSSTSEFLKGGGGQAAYFAPALPTTPWIGIGGGINHSYGGKSSIEFGISIPPGGGVNPISYGFETHTRNIGDKK